MKRVLIGFAVLLGVTANACAQTNVVPEPDDILRDACNFLAQSPQFNLTAEIWHEAVMQSGQKVQFTRTVTMDVKRPDRLYLEIRAPFSVRCFWFDGKTLTVLDRTKNFYSSTPLRGTIDDAVDAAHDQFGIDLPLIDMAVSDPYSNAMARVVDGTYFAVVPVNGHPCHHLAFTQSNIDWQVWIDAESQPFVRKFVIDHKTEERAPEFTALITRWNFDPLSDATFTFQPPPGASRIEMRKPISETAKNSRSFKRLASPREESSR